MLTQYLQECNRIINIDPKDRPVFTEHYDFVRDYVIDKMYNSDALFREIYHRYQLSGSYADQLKVSKPDEYDLLMILRFPYKLMLKPVVRKPGYVQIQIQSPVSSSNVKRLLDSDGYLIQNNVLEWLRNIVKRIFPLDVNLIRNGCYTYKVRHRLSGPAVTVHVQCDENSKFSIDFVGALEFSESEVWIADTVVQKNRLLNNSGKNFWNVVPKPRKMTIPRRYYAPSKNQPSTGANNMRNPNKNRDWICSYASIERELINGKQSMKPLIRIFKKIRDNYKMTNLKSYYIKQIFIHQLIRTTPAYWERSLGDLFLRMLDVVIERLEERNLPFIWHRTFSLLYHLNREQLDDLVCNFKRIRHDIGIHGAKHIYNVI